MNREGLRWCEEGATWEAAPLRLLSVADMDFMLEKGHRAWQGRSVIEMDRDHKDAIALPRSVYRLTERALFIQLSAGEASSRNGGK